MYTRLWIDMEIGNITAVKPDISGKEVHVHETSVQFSAKFARDLLNTCIENQGSKIVYEIRITLPEY